MPHSTSRLRVLRNLGAFALLAVVMTPLTLAAWGKKNPAQLLQEQRERRTREMPITCGKLRRLVDEGPPIFPPNANPQLPAVQEYAIKVLIDDARFVPVFGMPYDEQTEEEAQFLSQASTRYCKEPGMALAALQADKQSILYSMFGGLRGIYVRWLDLARSSEKALKAAVVELNNLPANSTSVSELKRINDLMARELQWVPGARTEVYRAAYKVAENRILTVAEGANAAKQIATSSTAADLRSLVKTAEEAAATLRATTDPDLRATREAQQRKLNDGISSLSSRLAQNEFDAFRALQGKPSAGLATLAEAKGMEQALSQRYGALLERPEFQQFNQERQRYRGDLYAANSAALVAEVSRAADSADIDSVLGKYLVPGDSESESLVAFRTASSARRRVVEPFSAFAGGDYLNAIYSGNFDLVYAADRKYFEGYQSMVPSIVQSPIAQAINMVAGGNAVGNAFDASNFSLVTPVLSVYLMNYGQTSKSCLRPGFKDYVIGTRVTTVRDTPFGQQIVDDFGVVGVTHYPVNKEFIPAFDVLGTTDPDDNFAFDLFVNGGKTTALFSGIRSMMASIPCGDARIARLEKNLLSYYNNRDTYRQKVLANREQQLRERAQSEYTVYHACLDEQKKLSIGRMYEDVFMNRCRADRSTITSAEIEKWQAGTETLDRLRERAAAARWSGMESGVRSYRCSAITSGQGFDREIQELTCMLNYQLTDADKEQIKRLQAQ